MMCAVVVVDEITDVAVVFLADKIAPVVVVVVLLTDEIACVPVAVDDKLFEMSEIVLQSAVETVTVVLDIVNLIVATFGLMLLLKSIHC
jgi:hypothetical protein